jgi:tetratricopeptide (TPR) repeat protein
VEDLRPFKNFFTGKTMKCFACLLLFSLGISSFAQDTRSEISVFRKPGRAVAAMQIMNAAQQAGQRKEYAEAETLCARAQELAPFFPLAHYNLACFQALQGKKDEALANLDKAVAAGFSNARHMLTDADLGSLRDDPKFRELATKAGALDNTPPTNSDERGKIENGVATVTRASAAYDPTINHIRLLFEPLDIKTDPKAEIIKGHGEVGKKLNQWFAEGTAAGNTGDLYDNCDRDHSNMDYGSFPQLTRVEYDPDIAKETAYGVQLSNLFVMPGLLAVIGNSSTAQTAGPSWRSNPRLAYTRPGGMEALVAQYLHNHLYFYPEHRDHDPGHNGDGDGYGDVYAANLPYVITSQGSSGSDRAFMDAVACTLAAFRPDVKQELAKRQMLMPAVQMIFRRSNKPVKTDEDYLTGIAHPSVFDGQELDVLPMIELAHSITIDSLPPMVMLRMGEEDKPILGRDYFDAGERERLFDSPMCIARVWRSTQQKRKYVLAAQGLDVNDKALTYHWKVLRGDARKIEIKPIAGGLQAEITMTWQGRAPILPESKMESNRIDIGVFAHNGSHYSAPAFFCVNTLDNEAREYNEAGRIKSVTYTGATDKGNYVDPAIDLPKSWRDDYRYDDGGKLLGWIRIRGEKQEEFTPDGRLIVEKDGEMVSKTQAVRYGIKPRPNNTPVLEQAIVD